jgi:crotonobetainyl-CoA:carnitine CoA-transferase CaiB-like acyl-CoA transferase
VGDGHLPLDDIRVLDLTIARAGPTAVRQLADWGADVIKVEPPRRESEASTGGERYGSDFQNLHRNKRSLCLDLKSDAGRAVFHRLVKTADVVVENMRPPVKHRLGVDYETLSAINPRLVYGSISGFGQDGPDAERGGVDQIAQGMGGLMSITGQPGDGPLRVGVPISDLAAGLYLAIGILVALHDRERTGEGQWVKTSLLEAMIAMLDFQATRWTMDGEVPSTEGNHHPTAVPMGCFPTADGYVNIAGPSGRLYRSFAAVLDLPELLEDARFATGADRSANRAVLNELIAARLRTAKTIEWVERLNAAGVPAGPVNRIDEAMAEPQVRHLGLEAAVEHPVLGTLSIIRNAVTMTKGPPTVRTATPEAGADTDAVLHAAGYSDEEISALRADHVI